MTRRPVYEAPTAAALAQPHSSDEDRIDHSNRDEMIETWSRLTATPTLPTCEPYVPESLDVWSALSAIQAGASEVTPERRGSRPTPSAGAIHPYDLIILTREGDVDTSFRVDLARRVCLRLDGSPQVLRAVYEAGLPEPPPGGAHIVILARPWLSMRKYGARGYVYAQLDTAHLAISVLGNALGAGCDASVRLRVPRFPLRLALPAEIAHHESSSVVTVQPSQPKGPLAGWRLWRGSAKDFEQGCDLLDEMQLLCWETIPHELHDSTTAPCATSATAFVDFPDQSTASLDLLRSWTHLSPRRSSAKKFVAGAVDEAALGRVLGSSTLPLPNDLAGGGQVTMTAYFPGRTIWSRMPSVRQRIIAACCEQDHLGSAAAFAVFHADMREALSRHRPHLIREALFRAGAAGHLIYMAATQEGIAVTGVGGFDSTRWREILGLPPERDVLYVVALGRSDETGVKSDRAAVAHAHGE